jgi:hypothetical protein
VNPDDWVWKHVKHDRIGRAGVTSPGDLKAKALAAPALHHRLNSHLLTFALGGNCLPEGVHLGEKQAGPAVDIARRTSSGPAGQLHLLSCGHLMTAQPVHAVGLAGGGPKEPVLQPLGLLQ